MMSVSRIYSSVLVALVAVLVINACTSVDKNGQVLDTPTSGKIKMAIDQTYQPLMEAEFDTFHALYNRAKVLPLYTSEEEAFQLLLKDSVRAIVVSRKISEAETAELKKIPITPRNIEIGTDALALITNNANPDSMLTFSQLIQIFEGKIKTWKELNPKSNLNGNIQIVFDDNGSSTARYIQETILKGKSLPSNCFATKSNPEVINYVEKNKNAIGVIGVSYVSDQEDPTALSFLKRINVLAVSPPDTSKFAGEYYKPYQAYVALKQYPLIRTIYIVSREARAGLGTGFASFVAGDKGQRIILKAGIVPATAPVRIIQFKK